LPQIVINEASNRNASQIVDDDGDYQDWFELYNAGSLAINLDGYTITDDTMELGKWEFPSLVLNPGNYLLVFASGKNRAPAYETDHWEFAVNEGVSWNYIIPNASTPADWMNPGFDDSGWNSGEASIGYGDGDDSTSVPPGTISAYLRHSFFVSDVSILNDAILHIDYDDGFAAYLNGNLIAQNGVAGFSAYDAASSIDHEAAMYAGYAPEQFDIDAATIDAYMVDGENVLAIEVHNTNTYSSDLTVNPYLSIAIADETVLWSLDTPVWFSSYFTGTNLHTNFSIASEGERLILSDASGTWLDGILVDDLEADFSIGRKADGNDTIHIFPSATPGWSNNLSASYTGYAATPVITFPAGFYSGTISVDITAPPGNTIYYTLNGQIPTSSDALYSGPVEITATTVLKARCYDDAGVLLPGKTITNTYFIDEDISIPVISITTNDENLYGSTGIYDNWWTDWKKPCYIEYFDSLHVNAFEQYAGIKIDGGAGGSRSLPQKSFRVEPDNSVYGDGLLHYPLIPRLWFVDAYERFYLRNGSNMWNVLPYKDAYMTRTTDGTLNEHMAYHPIVVFLNGSYWGLYELRDKLDEQHFEHAHNIAPENLDLLSLSYWYGGVLRTLSGSDTGFYAMRDYLYYYPTPSDTDFFDIANQLLDVYQFTDYLIGETYLGNSDWPWNNIKIWRDRGGDNKWKYALIDVEWGLGYGAWTNAYTDMISYMFGYTYNIEPFYALNQNEKFRHYFINRYADLMNTTFLPDRMYDIEDTIYNLVEDELPRQWETWGSGSLAYQYSLFNDYRFGLLDDLLIRSKHVRNHLESNYALDGQIELTLDVFPPGAGKIKISTITIYDMPWSGVYFNGVPVRITAIPNTGFTFDHWSDNPFISDTLNASFINNFTSDQTFTAHFTGAPAVEHIVVSEINYQSEASVNAGDWFEMLNAGDAAVNLSHWKIQDAEPLHSFTVPENTWINPGQRIVFVSDTALFQVQNPGISFLGPLGYTLSNNADTLRFFDDRNALKFEMHYGDSLPWPEGANGEGRTLELLDPAGDFNNPANWFDGCVGGSPGASYAPCNDAIIISEINYHSADTADSDDWIELRNISDTAVDISGWKFMDDTSGSAHEYIIPPSTVLEPHQHLVLAQNDFAFNLIYPDVLNYRGPFVFDLDNGGEWIRLYDAAGTLQNSVHYFDDFPWATEPDGGGYTLEVIDSLGKMNVAANWQIVCPQGSPGTYATTPCADSTVIELIEQGTTIEYVKFALHPNPADISAKLNISSLTSLSIRVELQDIQKQVIANIYTGNIAAGESTIDIVLKDLTAGVYFVHIVSAGESAVLKLVKQ
jgi:hypothetical protein